MGAAAHCSRADRGRPERANATRGRGPEWRSYALWLVAQQGVVPETIEVSLPPVYVWEVNVAVHGRLWALQPTPTM